MRLDLFLVEKGLAKSRTEAQSLIKEGHVYLLNENAQIFLKKSSHEIPESQYDNIRVSDNDTQKYVSRGGLKLDGALAQLNIEVKGLKVLDVGQSTGGFTDCLLRRGAAEVVGIDVGRDQLHDDIKKKKRVKSFEGINVKDLINSPNFLAAVPDGGFDMIVMDVSFISILKVTEYLNSFLKAEGKYLFLVKPQFECGAENLDKNGIVKNEKIYKNIEENVRKNCLAIFNNVETFIESKITGKDGNREFFIYGKKII